ncbi:MAG: calcium/sodium antiporter [Deltaproteobacteria bacterium]|nr:calcium/sodium antiporter [Deltaproteobacteria bacterium]
MDGLWVDVLLLVGGLIVVTLGAEGLIRGASRIAGRFGLGPLLIGLTVVAFGTSAPEAAIGVFAAWAGEPEIAIGNVVGSNIFNILFILGLTAIITPLTVAQNLVRAEVPVMIVTSALTWGMAWDGRIETYEGAILLAGAVGYVVFAVLRGRRESPAVRSEYAAEYATGRRSRVWGEALLVLVGIVLLAGGARILVAGATGLAKAAGLSDLVIGLTIVAVGTSVPEVATSVVAALRNERDIAVGNAVGSCLLNLLFVLGLSVVSAPAGVPVAPEAIRFDIPVMLATAVACLPIFFSGFRIHRWEGVLFFSYYVVYVGYLILDAMGNGAVAPLRWAMLTFVIPLTAVTLCVITFQALKRHRSGGQASERTA